MFYIFNSQSERRSFGSSAFVEIQFCKLKFGTKPKKLVNVNSIKYWQDDSLYVHVDDIDAFYQEYNCIFDCGIYNNLKNGVFDIYGINYYAPELTNSIIDKICEKKPTDYETLLSWLNKSKEFNGFYILGI